MNYDANPVRLLYNDEELKQRILMIIEGRDTITGCTFVNLCCQIAKMAFTEHKVKKADENTTLINEELAAEEKARMSCILWELIWEHKIVLLFGRSELSGLSNGEERFVKYSKSTPQAPGGTTPEIPNEFSVNNINYKILSVEDKVVEVAKSPNATGQIVLPSRVMYNGIAYSVVGIGDYAFDRNKKITSISLPNTIKTVGYCAFQAIKIPMSLPSSLEKVGGSAFTYNTFEDLVLPSGLKEIDKDAFAFTTVKSGRAAISSSVTAIEGNVFYAASIKEIKVSDGNPAFKSINGVLFSKDGRKLISYPMMKPDAVYSIPSGVTTIESDQCAQNLTRLVIPATINKLEDAALWSFPNLKTLELQGTTPPVVGKKSLNGVKSDCDIIVPKGCAVKYKAASGWKGHAGKIKEQQS